MPKAGDLPARPQVGDRIRLKEDWRRLYEEDSARAGFDRFDVAAVRVVTRVDLWGAGGGTRLFVDGPPFAFAPMHVKLAWPGGPQSSERMKAIREGGWRP
jgi:hypothetical protein